MAKETFERSKPHLEAPPQPAGLITGVFPFLTAGVLTSFTVTTDIVEVLNFFFVTTATSPRSASASQPEKSAFKLIESVEYLGSGGTLDILDAYATRLPPPALGDYVWLHIFLIDTISGAKYDYGAHSGITLGT